MASAQTVTKALLLVAMCSTTAACGLTDAPTSALSNSTPLAATVYYFEDRATAAREAERIGLDLRYEWGTDRQLVAELGTLNAQRSMVAAAHSSVVGLRYAGGGAIAARTLVADLSGLGLGLVAVAMGDISGEEYGDLATVHWNRVQIRLLGTPQEKVALAASDLAQAQRRAAQPDTNFVERIFNEIRVESAQSELMLTVFTNAYSALLLKGASSDQHGAWSAAQVGDIDFDETRKNRPAAEQGKERPFFDVVTLGKGEWASPDDPENCGQPGAACCDSDTAAAKGFILPNTTGWLWGCQVSAHLPRAESDILGANFARTVVAGLGAMLTRSNTGTFYRLRPQSVPCSQLQYSVTLPGGGTCPMKNTAPKDKKLCVCSDTWERVDYPL